MIVVKYGKLPRNSLKKYITSLINKTYKILPMREENSPTLKSYLNSYLVELVGCQKLVLLLANEPQFITIITTMTYLADNECSIQRYKKEIFKCIHILDSINKKYFEGEVSG